MVGSLKTAASNLAKYNLDLVRGVEGGRQPTDDYTFCYGNGNANHHLVAAFFFKRVYPKVSGLGL
jgi:hypothetical protein